MQIWFRPIRQHKSSETFLCVKFHSPIFSSARNFIYCSMLCGIHCGPSNKCNKTRYCLFYSLNWIFPISKRPQSVNQNTLSCETIHRQIWNAKVIKSSWQSHHQWQLTVQRSRQSATSQFINRWNGSLLWEACQRKCDDRTLINAYEWEVLPSSSVRIF